MSSCFITLNVLAILWVSLEVWTYFQGTYTPLPCLAHQYMMHTPSSSPCLAHCILLPPPLPHSSPLASPSCIRPGGFSGDGEWVHPAAGGALHLLGLPGPLLRRLATGTPLLDDLFFRVMPILAPPPSPSPLISPSFPVAAGRWVVHDPWSDAGHEGPAAVLVVAVHLDLAALRLGLDRPLHHAGTDLPSLPSPSLLPSFPSFRFLSLPLPPSPPFRLLTLLLPPSPPPPL